MYTGDSVISSANREMRSNLRLLILGFEGENNPKYQIDLLEKMITYATEYKRIIEEEDYDSISSV